MNEVLGALPPLARLLFQGLWCCADREGRLEDRPTRIKTEVLPYDACDVSAMLDDLSRCGFVDRYEVSGRRYIQVVGFTKHQPIHPHETRSLLPPPVTDVITCHGVAVTSNEMSPIITSTSTSTSFSPPTPQGGEALRSAKNADAAQPSPNQMETQTAESSEQNTNCVPGATACADAESAVLSFPVVGTQKKKTWDLRQSKLAEYVEAFPALDVLAEFRKALQWLRDHPSNRKTPRGMPAFLGRWLGRAQNDGPARNGRGPRQGPAKDTAKETLAESLKKHGIK